MSLTNLLATNCKWKCSNDNHDKIYQIVIASRHPPVTGILQFYFYYHYRSPNTTVAKRLEAGNPNCITPLLLTYVPCSEESCQINYMPSSPQSNTTKLKVQWAANPLPVPFILKWPSLTTCKYKGEVR